MAPVAIITVFDLYIFLSLVVINLFFPSSSIFVTYVPSLKATQYSFKCFSRFSAYSDPVVLAVPMIFSISLVSKTCPPILSPIIATSRPFLAAYIAAETADGPVPTTSTSYNLSQEISDKFPSSMHPRFKLKSIFPPKIILKL